MHLPERSPRLGQPIFLKIGKKMAWYYLPQSLKIMILSTYYQKPFAKGMVLQDQQILENSIKLVKKFDVRTPTATNLVSTLSGGNQQKVIVAREFSRPIKLLIASQPTRGLDVGSIEYIHNRVIEKRDDGCAVLLVSTELDEVMQLI